MAAQVDQNSTYNQSIWRWVILLPICIFTLLITLTLMRGRPVFWDEALYFRDIINLEKYGFSIRFLNSLYGPAGPLYGIVHYILKPITFLDAMAMRMTNVVFFIIILILLNQILKKNQIIKYSEKSLNLLGIPMIYVIAGMALTEMPAMLFCTIALYFLVIATSNLNGKLSYALAAFGGLSLGLAIIGRQPYLVILATIPVLFINIYQRANEYKQVICFIFFALIFPVLVFSVWGDIQPTATFTTNTGKGLAPFHGVLAYGYAGAVTLLLVPQWFRQPLKNELIILILLLLLMTALNYWVVKYDFSPAKSVAVRFLPPTMLNLYSKACPVLLTLFGAYFVFSSLLNVWDKREDKYFIFFTMSALAILFTTVKITHQFSSRYVAQAAPFMVAMLAYYDQETKYKKVRIVSGAVMGLIMLQSFFDSN